MTSTKPVPATQQPKTVPAQAATAPKPAKATRAALTPAQSETRERERAAKFVKLARPRLGRVLKGMQQLENLGRGQYVYSQDQAEKVLQHLVDGVARVKVAFAPKIRGARAAQELPEL